MPALLQELLTESGSVCRLDGDDLIVGHCYIERRLRPLDLFLRDADSAAAERALLDYGDALRELAGIDVFPGDLLFKNFGVTSQGKVVFYDYDEVTSLRECNFRDLPVASNEEEEFSAEPWFFVGSERHVPRAMAAIPGNSAGAARFVQGQARRTARPALVAETSVDGYPH